MEQHINTIRACAATLTDGDKILRHNITVGLDVYGRLTRGEDIHPELAYSARLGLEFPGVTLDTDTRKAFLAVAEWISAQPATGAAPATTEGAHWRDLCGNVYVDLGDGTVKHVATDCGSYIRFRGGEVDTRSEIERVYGPLSKTTDPEE